MLSPLGVRVVRQLDHCKCGYLEISRFNKTQVWDRLFPYYLQISSSNKMDSVGARKGLAGIMHHRCPMRGSVAMLGLQFSYRYLTLLEELPTIENWLELMHKHPLIQLQSGRAAKVTEFNDKFKEELEHIQARSPNFTLHGIRNQCIGEGKEDPLMRGDALQNGAGHSTGSHFDNYRGYATRTVRARGMLHTQRSYASLLRPAQVFGDVMDAAACWVLWHEDRGPVRVR